MRQGLREKATIVFMILAVFFSLFFAVETWLKNRISKELENISSARKNVLLRIAARSEKQIFLTRRLLPLLRTLSQPGSSPKYARNFFQKKYNINLSLYRFDSKGKLADYVPKRAPHLWLMRNLFPALIEKQAKKLPTLAKKLDKKIEFAFGFGKDLISIRENPERLIETFFNEQNGILAWTSRNDGGIIVYCEHLPDQSAIMSHEISGFKKQLGLEQTGIIKAGKSRGDSLAQKAFNSLNGSSNTSCNFAGKSWHFLKTFSGNIFFASFKAYEASALKILRLSRMLILLGATLAIFFFSFSTAALTLKFLLICMFLAASLIPLGGIAVTAIDNLEVFRQIEINKIRAAQEETLGNIAQNFSAYLTSCSATLLRQSDSPGNGTESPKTQAMKERILKIFPDARITLFNAAGERLFYHGSLQSEGRKILMKSIARKTVERYAPQRTKEHKYNGNPFADQIVGKDDMGFGTVLSHPNTLQMLKTGNSEQLLFYRTLTTKQSKGALIMIELSTYQSVRRYLESIKNKRFAVEQTFLTLSAFYQDGYRWVIPPLKAKEQVILKLAENTWVSNQPQFLLDAKTLQGFALAIKPALLSGICLIAISSDEHLKASLKSMQTRIWIGVFVALVLLSSVALWISSQLISPLKFLGMGVKALSERKFEARLPEPQGKDEIAQLFTAFNEMMAESYDMQIAKNVQEGLLPQKYPQIKGYSIHGFLREASELGGDCLDCFMLNETKMFFLIGDITGHGVGSALIMAFARAITFHWSQNSENLSPTHLADQIDVMLRHNNTSRMFMGIICGTLDIESNKLELVVKGHIYPLLIKANNDLSWVGIPAYPLGIGKKSPARSFTLDFESGDKLLCMTDGILETRSEQTTLGFAGIEKWALETKSDDARLWIKNIETLYSKWSQQKQQDDISIFALCNNREGNDETE